MIGGFIRLIENPTKEEISCSPLEMMKSGVQALGI